MHNNQLSIPSPKSRYHPQLFPTLLNLKSKSNSFYKLLQFQRDKTHSTSKKTYIYIYIEKERKKPQSFSKSTISKTHSIESNLRTFKSKKYLLKNTIPCKTI